VLWLLNSRFSLSRADVSPNEPSTMVARLVMVKPKPVIKPIDEEKPQAIVKEKASKAIQKTKMDIPAKKEAFEAHKPVVAVQEPLAVPLIQESIADKFNSEKQPNVKRKARANAQSIMTASKSYFQRQRSNIEVTYEKTAKDSMSLMTGQPAIHDYTFEPVSIEKKRQVKMTCDTGTKKVLVAFSGILGGTLRCNKGPDLSQFIKPKIKPKAR